MGLDIYLYTAEHAAKNDAYDAACEAFYGRPDYDELTEDQKKELRAELPSWTSSVDVPSRQYPDHLFNRRYLRSSYNDGGFNRAVPDYVGAEHDLYWIFEPMKREWDGDAGELNSLDVRLLRLCRARAEQVIAELKACDPLRVMTVDANAFAPPPTTSAEGALTWAREQLATKHPIGDSWWSNLTGEFFGNTGPKLVAACPGKGPFGQPGVHLVYRSEQASLDSYIQSAEIVCEFIDEAIKLIERDGSARLSWSG